MAEYVVLVGFNYPAPGKAPLGQAPEGEREGIRAEPGEIKSDLPAHFTGECGAGCQITAEKPESPHGWGLLKQAISPAAGFVPVVPEGDGVSDERPTFVAPATWHSSKGDVYHTQPACKLGNNVEVENRVDGDGGLSLCSECARLAKAAKKKGGEA